MRKDIAETGWKFTNETQRSAVLTRLAFIATPVRAGLRARVEPAPSIDQHVEGAGVLREPGVARSLAAVR